MQNIDEVQCLCNTLLFSFLTNWKERNFLNLKSASTKILKLTYFLMKPLTHLVESVP